MLESINLLRARTKDLWEMPIRGRVVLGITLTALLVLLSGYDGYSKLHLQLSRDAEMAADREAESVVDLLQIHRELYRQQVRASIELLKRDTLQLGPPHISGSIMIRKMVVPNLMFGEVSISNDTRLTDEVQTMMGGHSAIFVRQGETFIRVATNITDQSGARALETTIDPNGPAVVALRKGETYLGLIHILGSPYIGEDAPIFDDKGQVIGAWFVGFKIENLNLLMSRISSKRILENGFVVLFDTEHHVVAQSSNAQDKIVNSYCQEADVSPELTMTFLRSPWSIRKQTFEPWDYSIITATYMPDVAKRVFSSIWLIFSVVGLVGLAAMLALAIALVRSRQSKDEAEKARLAAEEASRTKSAFLANMSHELRTPLNAIIGYSEMLVEEAKEEGADMMEPDLRKIQSAGKHLLSLINDILDLSKIEAGKMTVYFEEVNIPQMVQEIASTIHPLLLQNGNELVVDCPDEVGVVYTDITKLRQILFNLLSNASKFTAKGKVRLKCNRDAKTLHFSVQDTGVGIPPEVQSTIFKEFNQADNSTTRKFGGTGLGLTISKRFCELMDGTIRLESQVNVGTTFFVDLPIKATPPAQVAAFPSISTNGATAESGSHDRPLVLIIDDDPKVQDLIQRLVEKEGYATRVLDHGQDAVSVAQNLKPSLITLDIMMPGIDGWAVLTALKNNPLTTGIPVIVVSVVDNKPLALALGASDYLSKPFDRGKFLHLLHKYGPVIYPRVMIVEDDINSYELLSHALEKDGFKVSYAPNGRVALNMLGEAKPSLIILDLMMPEMNGLDFLTELRRRDNGDKIAVMVLSARDFTDRERDIFQQRVQKTILKGSLSMHDLVTEVRRLSSATVTAKN